MSRPSPRRKSKYDDPIRTDATPEELAQSIFWRKPKPKKDWRYLKRRKATA